LPAQRLLLLSAQRLLLTAQRLLNGCSTAAQRLTIAMMQADARKAASRHEKMQQQTNSAISKSHGMQEENLSVSKQAKAAALGVYA